MCTIYFDTQPAKLEDIFQNEKHIAKPKTLTAWLALIGMTTSADTAELIHEIEMNSADDTDFMPLARED